MPGRIRPPGKYPRKAAGRRPAPARRRLLLLGHLQVTLGEFLDVDVLEGDHPDILHEPGRPVHVPDPGILHGDLEEDLAVVGGADVELDGVGEIEPALGLDHMAEKPDHVAVLAIELELHLGLVLLEVLRAHVLPSGQAPRVFSAKPAVVSRAWSPMRSTIGPLSPSACQLPASAARPADFRSQVGPSPSRTPANSARPGRAMPVTSIPLAKESRCSGHGPCSARALI